jgi:ABC-2 type transport system permease protein
VLTSSLLVFVLQMATIIVLGRFLFDTAVPTEWLSLAVTVLVGVLSFAGLGVGLASLIKSAEGSSAIVNVVLLPMAFLSGSFGPTRDYPRALQALADVLPLTYLIETLKGVLLEHEQAWEHLGALAVVLAWGLVGLAVALKRFSWEPRER